MCRTLVLSIASLLLAVPRTGRAQGTSYWDRIVRALSGGVRFEEVARLGVPCTTEEPTARQFMLLGDALAEQGLTAPSEQRRWINARRCLAATSGRSVSEAPTGVAPTGAQTRVRGTVVDVPLPEVNLQKGVMDFGGSETAPRSSTTMCGQAGDQPYFDFQVEKPVVLAPGAQGPPYPEELRVAGIEGTVLAQFVVNATGRADMTTFKAIRSDNNLFTDAVKIALTRMRFLPAELSGRKVCQLVQQPFQFSLNR